jgi:hypothetical protein
MFLGLTQAAGRAALGALLGQYKRGWSLPPKFYNAEALHRMVHTYALSHRYGENMYTHRFPRSCAYAGVVHMAQDMKKVWQTSWLFAGFTFQIPNTGDYFTYQVGDDSIIVIRGTSPSALLRVARAIG